MKGRGESLSSRGRGRRSCGLRGRACVRSARTAHGDGHDECRPGRADVLQSGDWRNRQGSPGARDRCAGRRDGRAYGCGGHPISIAEHESWTGGVVPARAMRQEAVSLEDARMAGK